MYTHCLFCHSDLGTNEVIESFPIGRRLAFDAAQGRLWVVCRKCERWNLTPVEERWEAIEQCERLFSSTRLKVSTDNIGMTRVSEGLQLVRIGRPQRPEMAAWRYGDQFGRRRMRYVGYTVGGAVIAGGIVVAGPMMGVSVLGGGWGTFQLVNALMRLARDRVVRTRVAIPGFDKPTIIRGRDIKRIVLGIDDDDRVTLRLPFSREQMVTEVTLRGDAALRAAGTILPAVNVKGGKKEEVQLAVQHLEATPDPVKLFAKSAGLGAARPTKGRKRLRSTMTANETFIDRIPPTMLLAMEMAAHEDVERRAMEGELTMLEAAWRQAEEIAAISDNLFVPSSVESELDRLKAR